VVDQKGFGGKVGVIGSGRSIYVASLFILNIGLARSLGPEGFGSFQQVFLFNILFIIFCMGIPETMYFFLPRLSEDEKPLFIGQTLMLLALSAIFIVLLFWFGASTIAGIQNNPFIEQKLKLFGIYGAFIIASSFADPVFIYFKRVRYLFILSALHGLFFIALTLWQYITESAVMTLFTAMGIFGFFKLILALIFLYRITPQTGRIGFFGGRHNILLQLSFALPIALSNSIDLLSRWLDKFVISIFLGAEPLGVFYIGAIEIPFVSVFVATVYSVISPVLNSYHHKKNYAGFVKLVTQTLKFTAKFIWPLCIYLFVFADHLIPLVFTGNYEGAVAPFRIYLTLMPIRIFLFGVIIIALGKPRIVLLAALGSLIVNLLLNIILIMHIGFLGPAIATVVSTYLQVIVLLWFILKNLKIRIDELIPFKKLFDIGLTSVLSVVIAFILSRAYVNNLKAVLISLTIFSAGYIFLGSRVGLFKILNIKDLLGGNFFGKKD